MGIEFVNQWDPTVLGSTNAAAFKADVNAAEALINTLFSPKNSVTVNVDFKEAPSLSNGDALQNSPPQTNGYIAVSYAALKAALPSSDTNLPATDPNPAGGLDWTLPEAYARMLLPAASLPPGFSAPAIDDTVTLSTQYSWSFGQDVINGLVHELSEGIMGRFGGLGDNGVWGPMDLFRYSSANTHDYTDGRDGLATYFSSNGTTLSSLSFNNEYSSARIFSGHNLKLNSGDTFDWSGTQNGLPQSTVFGSTGTGETLTLTQDELSVMQALGYKINLPQDIFASSTADNWQTPLDWSTQVMPITPEDAFIGVLGAANVISNSPVTVNSIGTNNVSSLTIAGNSTFTATNGTTLNPETTYSWETGNHGSINVDAGSTLTLGNALASASTLTTFDNAGSLIIGAASGAGRNGSLDIVGSVVLNGAGVVRLGSDTSTGTISGNYLTNVDNTISGSGSIVLNNFLNELTVAATQLEGSALLVSAPTFYNYGTMIAEPHTTLTLSTSGSGNAIDNGGTLSGRRRQPGNQFQC